MRKYFNLVFLVTALIIASCAGPGSTQSQPEAIEASGPSTVTTNYVTEITYIGGDRTLREWYFTLEPSTCNMWPSGAIYCETLGGPALVDSNSVVYIRAVPDSNFSCDSCAVTSYADLRVWVWSPSDPYMTEDVFEKFKKLTDQ